MACANESAEQEAWTEVPEKSTAFFRRSVRKHRIRMQRHSRRFFLVVLIGLLGMMASPAFSQVLPAQPNQLGPLPPKVPQLPTMPPPAQPPGFEMPSPRPGAPGSPVTGPKIMVKEIHVVGSTAFTPQQLARSHGALYQPRTHG